MAKVVFPSFREEGFNAFEMRQFVSAVDLRFQQIERETTQIFDTTGGVDPDDGPFAPLVHTHVVSDITDFPSSIFFFDDVTGSPNLGDVLQWNGSEFETSALGAVSLGLNDLTDVSIPAPNDEEVLQYDAGSGTWIAQPLAGGGVNTLFDLDDTDLSGQGTGDLLYNTNNVDWEPTGTGFQWMPSMLNVRLGFNHGIAWLDSLGATNRFAELTQLTGSAPFEPFTEIYLSWDAPGDPSYVDRDGNVWASQDANAQINSFNKFGTGAAVILGGNAGGFENDTITLASFVGDFHVGFWYYLDDDDSSSSFFGGNTFIGQRNPTDTGWRWRAVINNGNLGFNSNSGTPGSENNFLEAGPATNRQGWTYCAIERNSGTIYGYVGANRLATSQSNGGELFAGDGDIRVFSEGFSSINDDIYIDDVLVLQGTNLYGGAATITPPDAPTDPDPSAETFILGDPGYETQIDGTDTTITGNAQVDGTLGVTGAAAFADTLDVVGEATFETTVRLLNDTDVTPSTTDHAFQIGLTSGQNLRMDAGEILALDNGTPALLGLQAEGGEIIVAFNAGPTAIELHNNSSLQFQGAADANNVTFAHDNSNLSLTSALTDDFDISGMRLHLNDTTDVSLSSTNHPFQIGLDNGQNLRMDQNEIMAINNGAISDLNLQSDGGNITVGNITGGSTVFLNNETALNVTGTITFDDADGVRLESDNVIAGNPGAEGTGIQLDGVLIDSALKVSAIGGGDRAQTIMHRHSDTLSAQLVAARARGNTNAHTDVQSGDILFDLVATGWNTNTYLTSSMIEMRVDGTPGVNDMPGEIAFFTAPDGSNVPVERMIIRSDGTFQMNNSMFVNGTMSLEERAASLPDTAGRGQFWVLQDTPNRPMFTDDEGNDYQLNLSGGATLSGTWKYDNTTTAGDPGAGSFRTNNLTVGSVTAIYISGETETGVDANNLVGLLEDGDSLYLQNKEDASEFLLFDITSNTDNTGWYTLTGTVNNSGSNFTDGKEFGILLLYGGSQPETGPGTTANSILTWDTGIPAWTENTNFTVTTAGAADATLSLTTPLVNTNNIDSTAGGSILISDRVQLDREANSGSYFQVGPRDATLRGDAQEGSFYWTGEDTGVVYGSVITQADNRLVLQGSTFGGATLGTEFFANLNTRIGGNLIIDNTSPLMLLKDSNATLDEKNTIIRNDADQFRIQTATDAAPTTGAQNILQVTRAGTTPDVLTMRSNSMDINALTGSLDFQTGGVTRFSVDGANSRTVFNDFPLFIEERAAAAADVAGYGQLWVRNDTPNRLFFTDDAGTDYDLLNMGGGGSLPAGTITNSSLKWNGSAWVESGILRIASDHIDIRSGAPTIWFYETDVSAENQNWYMGALSEAFVGRAYNDAFNSSAEWLNVQRTGTAMSQTIDQIDLTATNIDLNADTDISGVLSVTQINANAPNNQFIINAGESASFATGQTGENVYLNAEGGLVVVSSPDNWMTGWAGRQTAFINNSSAQSQFPGQTTSVGNIIAQQNVQVGASIYGDSTAGGLTIYGGLGTDGAHIELYGSTAGVANQAYIDANVTNFRDVSAGVLGNINSTRLALGGGGMNNQPTPLVVQRTNATSDQVAMQFTATGTRYFGKGTDNNPYWSGAADITGSGAKMLLENGTYTLTGDWTFAATSTVLFNTNSNTNPVIISRSGGTAEALSIGLADTVATMRYDNDEISQTFQFVFDNADTETGGGVGANTHLFNIATSNTAYQFIAAADAAQPITHRLVNDGGGMNLSLGGTGQFQIQQTSAAGALEDVWISMVRNGGVQLRYNNVAQVATTSLGTQFDLPLYIFERAAANTDSAGFGQLWVRNDTPNKLFFTDDTGVDFDLTAGGGIGGTIADNQVAVGAATADTIEGSANLTWSGSELLVNGTVDCNFLEITSTTTTQITAGTECTFDVNTASALNIRGMNENDSGLVLEDGMRLRFEDRAQTNQIEFYNDGVGGNAATLILDRVGSFGDFQVSIPTSFDDQIVRQPILQDYAVQNNNQGLVPNSNVTLLYTNGNAFELNLANWSTNRTITISGGPPTGDYGQITVKITQDTTAARSITWAGGTFRWAGGTAHPLTSTLGGFSIYSFETWDGGTNWWGSGADYS